MNIPHKPRILIVDDDEEDRFFLNTAFEEMALSGGLHLKEGGFQAFQYLDELTEALALPTLIVLDLNMPVLDGIETLKRLKTNPRYKHIPVIVYTTSAHTLEKDQCLALGAADFIKKPANYLEMKSIVQLLFTYALDTTKP